VADQKILVAVAPVISKPKREGLDGELCSLHAFVSYRSFVAASANLSTSSYWSHAPHSGQASSFHNLVLRSDLMVSATHFKHVLGRCLQALVIPELGYWSDVFSSKQTPHSSCSLGRAAASGGLLMAVSGYGNASYTSSNLERACQQTGRMAVTLGG